MVIGRMYSFFYINGIPPLAAVSTDGVAGAALTSYEGQIPFQNAGATENTYLARMLLQSTSAGQWLLCDRLWHNSGINLNSTSEQTINSVAFPARDNDGSTNGAGVYVGLEITTTLGATTSTALLGYTNSAGTSGRSDNSYISIASSSTAGTFYPFRLQGSDAGVRSIQTIQMGTANATGAASLVAYRVLGRLGVQGSNIPYSMDLVSGGAQKAYNNSVPFLLFIPTSTSATTVVGHVVWTVA